MAIINDLEFRRDSLERSGVILNGHFILSGGEHSEVFVDKMAIRRNASLAKFLCKSAISPFRFRSLRSYVDVIVAPIGYSSLFLHSLVCGLEEENLGLGDGSRKGNIIPISISLEAVPTNNIPLFAGAKVLIFTETLTTGDTARKLCSLTEGCGGDVVGLATFINRGEVAAEDIGVPTISSYYDVISRFWESEDECSLCRRRRNRISINTDFGHGAEFLARKEEEKRNKNK